MRTIEALKSIDTGSVRCDDTASRDTGSVRCDDTASRSLTVVARETLRIGFAGKKLFEQSAQSCLAAFESHGDRRIKKTRAYRLFSVASYFLGVVNCLSVASFSASACVANVVNAVPPATLLMINVHLWST